MPSTVVLRRGTLAVQSLLITAVRPVRHRGLRQEARHLRPLPTQLADPTRRPTGPWGDRDNLRRDRSRMNWRFAHGWQMRYFTDLDLYHRPQYVVATVAGLLRS
jgi:hypothetical protein